MRARGSLLVTPCALFALGLALALGCSEECVDADGDGFGEGCSAGRDCDDTLATRAIDCSEPPPDCERDELTPGCPCIAGTERECYGAIDETIGVAECRVGRQQCLTGSWGECEGAVLPTLEQCNGDDDDCDGKSDEGVRSPCGQCNGECTGGVWGEGDDPFVASEGLALGPRGELMLERHSVTTATLFIPNSGEATVSAVDPDAATERARYRVAGAQPEHVAIDYRGRAYVLDASVVPAQLTEIAGEESACVDRDGDGVTTSHGPSELLPLGEDECVLRTFEVPSDEPAAALAIGAARAPDADETALLWVGVPERERVLALHGETGELIASIETEGVRPYAVAIDPWGTLWVLDRAGVLAAIEPDSSARDGFRVRVIEAPLGCYVLESIAIDREGVLTMSGGECESVVRYEPAIDRWSTIKTPGVLDTRSVAVVANEQDEAWVTHAAGRISRLASAPLELLQTYSLAGDGLVPFDSDAVSSDAQGRLWIVSSGGGTDGNGVLTRFDVASARVDAQVVLGYLPRAQGDFSGVHRFGTLEPEAVATHVFEGCNAGQSSADPAQGGAATDWIALHVAGLFSEGSEVEVELRQALDRPALREATFESLGTLPADTAPFPLELGAGGLVEVRLTLRSSDYLGGPRIARVGLEWHCPGPE